jgi:hypothetical protein
MTNETEELAAYLRNKYGIDGDASTIKRLVDREACIKCGSETGLLKRTWHGIIYHVCKEC